MTLTISHAVRVPIFLILVLTASAWFIGKKGLNETIDLAQEILAKIGDDKQNSSADTNTETQTSEEPEPLDPSKNRSTKIPANAKMLEVEVWDGNEFSVSQVCVVLRDKQLVIDQVNTGTDGSAILNFDSVKDNTVVQLVLDPYIHGSPTFSERNMFSIVIHSEIYASKYCFRKLPPAESAEQGKDYEFMPDCLKPSQREPTATPTPTVTPTPDPYPAPDEPQPMPEDNGTAINTLVQNPINVVQGKVPTPVTVEPQTFSDGFDDNTAGWQTGRSNTETASVEGHVFMRASALVFQQIFSDDFRMYRTPIPLERPIQDFTLTTQLAAVVHPQTENGLGRFNLQMRAQPNKSYYNLSIDHAGVTTLIYTYLGPNGQREWEYIDEFHLDGYLTAEGALNEIMVTAQGNVFMVQANAGQKRVMVDRNNSLNEAGEMSIGIDGSADNMIGYRMDRLLIEER